MTRRGFLRPIPGDGFTRRAPFLPCAAVLAAAASFVPAAAVTSDETQLFGDLPSVFSASRFEQTVSEAPAAVTVVTAEEIRRYGWRTLAEALRSVRGLYTSYDRNYTFLGVRGFGRPGDYNTRVLVLIDGQRVNDNVFDAAYYGTEALVDLALVERIEVIRGPASSLYGTSAFLGVVNLVTKRGRDLKGVQAEAAAGSFGTKSGQLAWGHRFAGGFEALASASVYASDGQDLYFPEFDDPATNAGVARGADGDEGKRALIKFARGDWSLETAWMDREKHVPTGSYGSDFGDPSTRTTDRSLNARLGWDHALDDGSRIAVSGSYNDYAYEGLYPYSGAIYADWADGSWWTLDAQHERRFGKRHRAVFGAFYQKNTRQEQGAADLDPYFLHFRDERRSSQWAIFAQDEIRLGTSWIVSVGIRHDDYESFGGTTNPRAAVIWGADRATTLKLLYGKAFRAPNAYEKFYADGVTNKGNPDLDPERIETWEAVVERRFGEKLRGSLSAYQFELDGLISQVLDPADDLLVFENLDRVKGHGLEVEVEAALPRGIDVRASWALQDAEDRSTGETLTNSPRNLGRLNVHAPLAGERLGLGMEVQYTGARRSPVAGETDGFTVVNLNLLARRVAGGLDLALGLYNALDREYADPASEEFLQPAIPQDGRSWKLTARYSF